MHAEKLVKMANQIAEFFEGEPDRAVTLAGIAGHLKRFWDPRMRRELLRFIDDEGGHGLRESVLAAVAGNRDQIAPAPAREP